LLNNDQQPLFNRAIAGLYPTGSTIKPLIASAALQEKIIKPQKELHCQGGIMIPHRYDPDIIYSFKDWKTHGFTDTRKAIAESCNVYFYTIGGGYGNQEGLGPNKIKKYLEFFGWAETTDIDLPGEAKGSIPNPAWKKENKGENWWDGDTYNLSIGQGDILVTPLQVTAAFSAVVNGGYLLEPQVVQKIVDSEKNLVETKQIQIVRENFIDFENLKIIREGMRGTVTYGTATLLNSLPVEAAAKTGTAQSSKPDYFHNWITVFAPYDDPQIVLTIVIEDVKELQALPIPLAKEILNWYFSPK
ncbi:penicillin-binding transpeptidase domain-containing protein, partial [Patescibacteria group bacterium]